MMVEVCDENYAQDGINDDNEVVIEPWEMEFQIRGKGEQHAVEWTNRSIGNKSFLISFFSGK